MRQTATDRLDVRFFARPATKERGRSFLLSNCHQRLNFVSREKVTGNVLTREVRFDVLDVDSNLVLLHKRVNREFVRMRSVETQAARIVLVRQRRFAVWAVNETYLVRREPEITAQQHAQKPATEDEPPPVLFKMEAAGARPLVLVQQAEKRLLQRHWLLQIGAPHVYFTTR
jgi:hypothetical protein